MMCLGNLQRIIQGLEQVDIEELVILVYCNVEQKNEYIYYLVVEGNM